MTRNLAAYLRAILNQAPDSARIIPVARSARAFLRLEFRHVMRTRQGFIVGRCIYSDLGKFVGIV
jgi:hypothetical protein